MRPTLIASALISIGLAQAADSLLWGNLDPGRYAVGYRAYFEFDPHRHFGSRRRSRPVLVCVWYPAAAGSPEPMLYRQYLALPQLPQYPQFGSQLESFLLDTVSDDLFERKRVDLKPDERLFLDVLLRRSTLAHYNAAAAPGRFPIILYHSGAAGSYEDNSVLCEYLASRGFVVMTSAFQSPDGQHVSNNYGGPETSWADLTFLLASARKLPFADPLNAGGFGHSMGAQYLLEWIGQRKSPLRALVSLDTTLEYTQGDFAGHRSLRQRLSRLRPPSIAVLIVASADRHPNFSTWDRYLPHRYEAAIPYFGHNDYLIHGSLARAFSRSRVAEVRRNYDHLAMTVGAFFDAHLRGEPSDWQRLLSESTEDFRVSEQTVALSGSGR